MTIITSDHKRFVDIGTSDIWNSLYATISFNLKRNIKKIPLAIHFMDTEYCDSKNALETAHQFNLIRDMLSQFSPQELVYNLQDPKGPAPWDNNISPVVTSCANFYTTTNGEDLLYEIVSILCYSGIVGVSVSIQW